MPQYNYCAKFKEKDLYALALENDFQGTFKVSQVKLIPFADCCVKLIHQSLLYRPICDLWICENHLFIEEYITFSQKPMEAFESLIFKNL